VDIRKPEQLLEPPADADYLVFAQNADIAPAKQNVWAMRRGCQPFLRVDSGSGDECLFPAFQRNPIQNPGVEPTRREACFRWFLKPIPPNNPPRQ